MFVKSIFRWLLKILFVLWLLLLLIVGAKFMQDNGQPIAIDVLGWLAPEVPVGGMIMLAFTVGICIGVFAIAPLLFWRSWRFKKLKKRHDRLQDGAVQPAVSVSKGIALHDS